MATIVGKKIKELRLKAGHKAREYARLTGVSHANILNIESGKIVNVRRSTLEKLVLPLGYTVDEFLLWCMDATTIHKYPVINMAKCSFDDMMDATDKGFPPGCADEFEVGPGVPDPHAYMVRAAGDSMIDRGINDGDLLLITPSLHFEYEKPQLIIFRSPGQDGQATVKTVYPKDATHIRLRSETNPKWEERIVDLTDKTVIIHRIYYIIHKN